MTTVGYGDVVAITISERLICLLLMSFGIALYSSLFQPMDETQKKLRVLSINLHLYLLIGIYLATNDDSCYFCKEK